MLEAAHRVFSKTRSYSYYDNMKVKLRQRMVNCLLLLEILQSIETLKTTTLRRLNKFEVYTSRRILSDLLGLES